jgi:quercetin dioxygenase-like cupin family protein
MIYRIDFTSIPWETPMKGVRHKAIKQGDKQLRLVEYSKYLEPHWCEKGHIGYILEGQFEITFENERLVYNPGDGVFIPAGSEHKHSGRVLSDVVRVVFVEEA